METAIRISPLTSTSASATAKAEKIAAAQEKALMMRKVVKFVLGCYILLMFKPAMPLISDFIAHTFYEQKHILMVHEVNGKFHIHQELAKAGNQSEQQKSNELKVEVEQYIHVLPSLFKALLSTSSIGTYPSYIYHYPITLYSDACYPPPQATAPNTISGAIWYMEIISGFQLKADRSCRLS